MRHSLLKQIIISLLYYCYYHIIFNLYFFSFCPYIFLLLSVNIFVICCCSCFRQCALTLGQLCNSMTLGVLQSHCRDSLWYRVPRDAPSTVDLGEYMFHQTEEFLTVGGSDVPPRKVATLVCLYQNNVFFIYLFFFAFSLGGKHYFGT